MTDLLALAAEIEALTGPDMDMNTRIAWRLLYPTADESPEPGTEFYTAISRGIPRYTKSIDAAYALGRELFPGWAIDMWCRDTANASVIPPTGSESPFFQGRAPTLPLAICAAVVRAVAQSRTLTRNP